MTTPPWIDPKHDERCAYHEDNYCMCVPAKGYVCVKCLSDCTCDELKAQDYEDYVLDRYHL